MKFSGIILAGGKSSRMGQDKAMLSLNGKPMIQHVSEMMRGICDEIIIASNNPEHEHYGDLRVADQWKDVGPLAGIQAGLQAAQHENCFVISCDTPFVTIEVLSTLASHSKNHSIIVARNNDRIQPLIGVYTKRVLHKITAYLNQDTSDRSLRTLLEQSDAHIVDFTEAFNKAFENINTPEEWQHWNILLSETSEQTRNVTVTYYGMLAEKTGTSQEQVTLPGGTISLRRFFEEKHPELQLQTFSIAVDLHYAEELVANEIPTKIDLMPPFAGG